MTQTPLQPEESRLGSQRKRKGFWLKVALGVGAVGMTVTAVGAVWVTRYVRQNLAPLIQDTLTQIFNRPIEVGELEQFRLSSVRFGASGMPATSTDPDRVDLQALEVRFDPWQVLTTRVLAMDIIVIEPQIYVEQNAEGVWLETEIVLPEEKGPIEFEVKRVEVKDGALQAVPMTQGGEQLLAVDVTGLQADATVQQAAEQVQFDLQGDVASASGSGGVRIEGETDFQLQQGNFQLRIQDLPIPEVVSLVQNPLALPIDITTGIAGGNITLGIVNQELASLGGSLDVEYLTAQSPDLPFPLTQVGGRLRFQDDVVKVEAFQGQLDIFVAAIEGSINRNTQALDLTALVKPTALPDLLKSFEVDAPVAIDGSLQAAIKIGGTIDQPDISGALSAADPLQVDRLVLSSATTRFKIPGLPTPGQPLVIDVSEILVTPDVGGAITGGGKIILGDTPSINLDFASAGLVTEQLAQLYEVALPIQVGTLDVQANISGDLDNPQTLVRWQALEADYPAQGQVRVQGDEIILDELVASVAGGAVQAQGQQVGDRWLLTLGASRLLPSELSAPLDGFINAQVTLSGPRNVFDPEAVRATGKVLLSAGVSVITSPLTADFVWNGENIQVRQAVADNFRAQGVLDVALEGEAAPGLTGVNLQVQLTDYLISSLPIDLPPAVDVKGSADFRGTITGSLDAPVVQGRLDVAGLGVNQLGFEPLLVGTVSLDERGVNLQLAGQNDRIQVALDPAFEPQLAFVKLGDGVVEARKREEQLQIDMRDFPIALLSLQPPPQLSDATLEGTASGQVLVDLDPLTAIGSIAVNQPSLGYLQANQFQTNFRFNDNILTLDDGLFLVRDSRFNFNGRAVLADDPQFKLNVAVNQGNIQDIFRTLQWFDLIDLGRGIDPPVYATASDILLAPVGNPNQPLKLQLHRFAELKSKVGQTIRRRQQERRLPPLTALDGRFDGAIEVAGSLSQGVDADFRFEGENWTWGEYQAEMLLVQGEFANNQVTLQPVQIAAEDAEVTFAGTVGGDNQAGQLQVRQVPLDLIRNFVEIPLDVQGQVDLTATLAGSVDDPQFLGDINLVDGTLNQVPLQTRETGFNYREGRLGFGSILEVEAEQPEPVVIQGSLPIPLGNVKPKTNDISLSLNVKDDGLALLNLLQDQVRWLGGGGEVTLEVGGTVEAPVATGLIELEQASLTATALPAGEAITDLSGIIQFVQDRIQVDQLNGLFSEGQVDVVGVIPIAVPFRPEDPDRETPLQVSFRNLNLNLPGIYRGGAGGEVQVVGSVRNPRLTGLVSLAEGDVIIPDPATSAVQKFFEDPEEEPAVFTVSPVVFDNLRLQLVEDIEIASRPLFSFFAEGELRVNGPLNDIRPDGTIMLTRGEVNLFTTNFTLNKRHDNVAVFRPNSGLDPDLDVQMVAAVTEVSNRAPAAGPLPASEIAEARSSAFNELETIQIRAEVNGPASTLLSSLVLSSRPARSQSELYALIGGGFINTLGQGGDSTLALANLAGSALITNLQSQINRALSGPVDFRLFPTLIDSSDRREQAENEDGGDDSNAETLALGAEVGINLTNSLSFSVLRLLTVDIPTRYNVRYQLNDNWQFRATSDFQDENRLLVEYEARF